MGQTTKSLFANLWNFIKENVAFDIIILILIGVGIYVFTKERREKKPKI